jgi:hypothetical protein
MLVKAKPREFCPPCGIERAVYAKTRRFYNHRLGSTQEPCPAGGMTREAYEAVEAESVGMRLDDLSGGRP